MTPRWDILWFSFSFSNLIYKKIASARLGHSSRTSLHLIVVKIKPLRISRPVSARGLQLTGASATIVGQLNGPEHPKPGAKPWPYGNDCEIQSKDRTDVTLKRNFSCRIPYDALVGCIPKSLGVKLTDKGSRVEQPGIWMSACKSWEIVEAKEESQLCEYIDVKDGNRRETRKKKRTNQTQRTSERSL